MTHKKTMPEPVAWIWDTDTSSGLTWTKSFPPDEEHATSSPLITTDQAEAYANERVREALEEAIRICTDIEKHYLASNPRHQHRHGAGLGASLCADRIRALIPKENKS